MSDPLITVCSECLRACCWLGDFLCDDAAGASTVQIPLSQLRRMSREHPIYWRESIQAQKPPADK